MTRSISRRAPAKLNLALAVAPPRPTDGLHPICSWFAPISMADELRLEQAAGPSRYEIRWAADAPRPTPIDWPLEKDLAVRAHRLLEAECGRSLPISLTLTKRIPVGGGLGGGSSDAAAMLLAALELFGLELSRPRLRELALGLGSDVPYFLSRPLTPAVVEGVGEKVTPLPMRAARLILILPPFGCPTGAVYRAFDAEPPRAFRADDVYRLARGREADPHSLFNDLARAAQSVEPRLAEIRRRGAEVLGQPVHVTGSGSALFAVLPSDQREEDAAPMLAAALPACVIAPARVGEE